MKRTSILRKTSDWERARPDWAVYEHFFYNDAGQVRKVEGLVEMNRLMKDNADAMVEVNGYIEVRWDGYGYCWSVLDNTRKKDHDIHFD